MARRSGPCWLSPHPRCLASGSSGTQSGSRLPERPPGSGWSRCWLSAAGNRCAGLMRKYARNGKRLSVCINPRFGWADWRRGTKGNGRIRLIPNRSDGCKGPCQRFPNALERNEMVADVTGATIVPLGMIQTIAIFALILAVMAGFYSGLRKPDRLDAQALRRLAGRRGYRIEARATDGSNRFCEVTRDQNIGKGGHVLKTAFEDPLSMLSQGRVVIGPAIPEEEAKAAAMRLGQFSGRPGRHVPWKTARRRRGRGSKPGTVAGPNQSPTRRYFPHRTRRRPGQRLATRRGSTPGSRVIRRRPNSQSACGAGSAAYPAAQRCQPGEGIRGILDHALATRAAPDAAAADRDGSSRVSAGPLGNRSNMREGRKMPPQALHAGTDRPSDGETGMARPPVARLARRWMALGGDGAMPFSALPEWPSPQAVPEWAGIIPARWCPAASRCSRRRRGSRP
jgi:hypothetical protein